MGPISDLTKIVNFNIGALPPVKREFSAETPNDRFLAALHDKGWIDSAGRICKKKFENLILPPLNQAQIKALDDFLDRPFAIIDTQGAERCKIRMCDLLTSLRQKPENIQSIEIIGGFARHLLFLSADYIRDAFSVLGCSEFITDELIFHCQMGYSDYDIRINCPWKEPTENSNAVVRYLAQQTGLSLGTVQKTCFRKFKYEENHYAITSFGNRQGEDIELLHVQRLARPNLFELDAIKINLGELCLNACWQGLIDLLTKRIHVENIETVNADGFAILMMRFAQGFTTQEEGLCKKLMAKGTDSLEKCRNNHFQNDPMGAFMLELNARAWTGNSDKPFMSILETDDPILLEIYNALKNNPAHFDVIYSLLHIAAHNKKLKSSLTTFENKPALQIPFGKYYLLQPLDIEKALHILFTAKSLPELPRLFSLVDMSNIRWESLDKKEKKKAAPRLIKDLLSTYPARALTVFMQYPQDIGCLGSIIASFQNPKHSIAFQASLDNVYSVALWRISKPRPSQKTLLQRDPFCPRLLWLIEQCASMDQFAKAHQLLERAVSNQWLPSDSPSVISIWLNLCDRTFEQSPELAMECYTSGIEINNISPDGLESLLRLTERFFEQKMDPTVVLEKILKVSTPPMLADRIQSLIQIHLKNLIDAQKIREAENDLYVYKNRITPYQRTELLLSMIEAQLNQNEVEKAEKILKQLAETDLSDEQTKKLAALREKFPAKTPEVAAPEPQEVEENLLEKIDLFQTDPKQAPAIVDKIIASEDVDIALLALSKLLQNLNPDLFKQGMRLFNKFSSKLRKQQPAKLCAIIVSTAKIQSEHQTYYERTEYLQFITKSANTLKECQEAYFNFASRNNKTSDDCIVLYIVTLRWCINLLKELKGDNHLVDELSSQIIKLSLDAATSGEKLNWQSIYEIVREVYKSNNIASKRIVIDTLQKYPKDDSEECRRIFEFEILILIQLNALTIPALLEKLSIYANNAKYINCLLRVAIKNLAFDQTLAIKTVELLKNSTDASQIFDALNSLFFKKNFEYFKLGIQLLNHHFTALQKEHPDQLLALISSLEQFLKNNSFRKLITEYSRECLSFALNCGNFILKSEKKDVKAIEFAIFFLLWLGMKGKNSLSDKLMRLIPDNNLWNLYFIAAFSAPSSLNIAEKVFELYYEQHKNTQKYAPEILATLCPYITGLSMQYGFTKDLKKHVNRLFSLFINAAELNHEVPFCDFLTSSMKTDEQKMKGYIWISTLLLTIKGQKPDTPEAAINYAQLYSIFLLALAHHFPKERAAFTEHFNQMLDVAGRRVESKSIIDEFLAKLSQEKGFDNSIKKAQKYFAKLSSKK